MSQWSREHPELCDEGYGYEDFHDPDRIRMEIKDGVRPDPKPEETEEDKDA
jgi:hypothetical protein